MRISSRDKRLEDEKCAGVAQLVEQRIRNAKVVGSTPIIGTISLFPRTDFSHFLYQAQAV